MPLVQVNTMHIVFHRRHTSAMKMRRTSYSYILASMFRHARLPYENTIYIRLYHACVGFIIIVDTNECARILLMQRNIIYANLYSVEIFVNQTTVSEWIDFQMKNTHWAPALTPTVIIYLYFIHSIIYFINSRSVLIYRFYSRWTGKRKTKIHEKVLVIRIMHPMRNCEYFFAHHASSAKKKTKMCTDKRREVLSASDDAMLK